MKRWIAIAALSALGCVHAPGRDCFRRHLQDAIALNEARRPRYAALSGGASLSISDELISTERLTLLVATYFNLLARRYQDAGIPLACREFVPMASVPPMAEAPAPPATAERTRVPIDGDELSGWLIDVLDGVGPEALRASTNRVLAQLSYEPDRHCMVRHLLESTRRAAGLSFLHEQSAARAGLDSPRALSEQLMRLHLMALPRAAEFDARAAKIQEMGVPIVCGDLPEIPEA